MFPLTVDAAKRAARALRESLSSADLATLTHAQALETLAHTLGYRDWNTYSAALRTPRPLTTVPVLRSYDSRIARRFYCDYLGFEVIFEHRFAPDLPLYFRITRGEVHLDLSEHHGDGTPGSVVWIATAGLDPWYRELRSKDHLTTLRPAIDRSAPGGPTLQLTDPFQNILRLCEPSD
ncbi:glyoxalase superfamily protein [Nocardia sp. NPDC003482]